MIFPPQGYKNISYKWLNKGMIFRPHGSYSATSQLLDPNNSEAPATSSHRQSIACATAAKEVATQGNISTLTALTPATSDIDSDVRSSPTLSIPSSESTNPSSSNKRPLSEIVTENEEDSDSHPTVKKPKKKRAKHTQKIMGKWILSDTSNTHKFFL